MVVYKVKNKQKTIKKFTDGSGGWNFRGRLYAVPS
jgi:hypothetical protein